MQKMPTARVGWFLDQAKIKSTKQLRRPEGRRFSFPRALLDISFCFS
jgi:hypothetical protein